MRRTTQSPIQAQDVRGIITRGSANVNMEARNAKRAAKRAILAKMARASRKRNRIS